MTNLLATNNYTNNYINLLVTNKYTNNLLGKKIPLIPNKIHIETNNYTQAHINT